jgi:hypothetical protein
MPAPKRVHRDGIERPLQEAGSFQSLIHGQRHLETAWISRRMHKFLQHLRGNGEENIARAARRGDVGAEGFVACCLLDLVR